MTPIKHFSPQYKWRLRTVSLNTVSLKSVCKDIIQQAITDTDTENFILLHTNMKPNTMTIEHNMQSTVATEYTQSQSTLHTEETKNLTVRYTLLNRTLHDNNHPDNLNRTQQNLFVDNQSGPSQIAIS